jgi:antibiotic biosynthesis monooxygenase (ABM) superfamily enzyme
MRLLGILSRVAAMSDTTPAKIIIERRVRPGAEAALKSWAERFIAHARGFPGHEGGSVLAAGPRSYFLLIRFASALALDEWQRSSAYASLMHEAEAVSTGHDDQQIQSGLETWFTLPEMPAPMKPPAKWKMALLTWLALLPQVVILGFLLAPLQLPFFIAAPVSTAIPVALLTWLIMPRLTRALYPWLYA